jgi:hypothetical protein
MERQICSVVGHKFNMKNFAISAILCFMAQLILAQDTNSGPKYPELLAEAKKLAHSSLAYRIAAAQRLLAEVNYTIERLKLPTQHSIQFTNAKNIEINAPLYSMTELWYKPGGDDNLSSRLAKIRTIPIAADGVIETTNFFFSFKAGKSYVIVRSHEPAMEPGSFHKLVGVQSLINDSQAYTLATQWLAAISVDVTALEQKYKPKISQQKLYYPQGTTNKVSLPIYFVKWGGNEDYPAVKVTILGTTKELMELRMENRSFSRRPPMIIPNARELNSIPDPPMKHLSGSQTNSTSTPLVR